MGLTCSRPDVEFEFIQTFDVADRFVKLPIAAYFELLGMQPIRPQTALINAVNNPKYRFIVACLSRRTGKTEVANIIAQLVALIPGKNVLIMSPNYNLSEISFSKQRQLLKKFNIEIVKDNAKDRIIELANGSTIRMGSISQVDSCVGRSYDLILFDEAALDSKGEDAFNVALRPTMDRPGSKAIFISTPRGKNNYFAKFYAKGFTEEDHDWVSIWSDYRENPRMLESDVASAKRSMSSAEFQQEYEASFNSFEGQIYQFKEECIMSPLSVAHMEGFAGLDVGFRDPTALICIEYEEDTGLYWVVDEYLEAEKTTAEHAEVIKEKENMWNLQAIYIDSAAQQTKMDLAYNYDVTCVNAHKSVLDGIAFVQTIVEQNRLRVAPHCTHTLQMLDQYRWDPKDGLQKERPLHDKYSHMADALRYGIYTFSPNSGTV